LWKGYCTFQSHTIWESSLPSTRFSMKTPLHGMGHYSIFFCGLFVLKIKVYNAHTATVAHKLNIYIQHIM
jgi:hypothetical protein